jgi:hypothetical protein
MGTENSKKKYHQIRTNDHEMEDFKETNKSFITSNEKAFDFAPAHDYKSIFTYTTPSLKRQNNFYIDSGNLKNDKIRVFTAVMCKSTKDNMCCLLSHNL